MSSRPAQNDTPRTTSSAVAPANLPPNFQQHPRRTPPAGTPAATLTTPQILSAISRETQELMKAQIDLLKAEVKADLTRELSVVKGLGVAALAVLAGLNLLLVTGVLALSLVMPGCAAGLLVTAAVWLVGGAVALYAWRARVRKPLARSRRAVEQDVRFVKESLT